MATRRERVLLELDDQFSTRMARAAASTALLARELDGLDGSGRRGSSSTDELGRSAEKSGASIDKLSGRVRILAEVAGVLGPSLIPIGAVGIPAISGLAAQFGFAALGAGTALGAFQGVGDALKAMNKAQLEPTVENLEAAQLAMNQIGPDAQQFVVHLREMIPALKGLRDTAAAGMFPGLTEGLDSMESLLPKVERIVAAVSGELGSIGADAGASLASGRWADFFDFLATDAPSALRDMAQAAGNTTHAMAELWMAFDPLNDDFSRWLVDATTSLDKWATGLSKTDGFAEFMQYIDDTGPQVGETLASIANAMLQVTEAAAPVAGPVLKGVEAFADAVSAIADSDLGTPIFGMVAALSALNLALRTSAALSKGAFGGTGVASLKQQVIGYKGIAAAQREVASATTALSMAELSRNAAAVRGRNAQSALIPTADKRGAVNQYVAAAKAQEVAAKRVADAERARSAAVREGAVSLGKTGAVVAGLAVATSGLGDKMNLSNTASLAMMGMMAGPYGAAIGAAAGLTIDLAHANDDLRESTTKAHEAFKTGDVAAMVAQYDILNKKIDETRKTSMFDPRDAMDRAKALAGVVTGATAKGQKEAAGLAGGINATAALGAAEAFTKLGAATGLPAKGYKLTALSAARAAEALATSRKSAHDVAKSFTGLGDSVGDAKVSLGGWLRELEANASALRNFADNAQDAAKKGLAEGLIKELQAAGPEGALRMKQLADASEKEIARANRAWRRAQAAIREYTDAVGGSAKLTAGQVKRLTAQVATLPKDVRTNIIANGIPKTEAGLKALQRRYNLTPKQVRTLAMLADLTPAVQRKILAGLRKLDGTTAKPKANLQDNASGKIRAISASLGALNGKAAFMTATTIVKTVREPSARGNIFRYAYGDVANRHQAELAGPGDIRVWREPETMGEAYIPLANDDRRPRARSIAEETVGLLGGNVEWYARGGKKGGKKPESPRHKHIRDELDDFKDALTASTKAIDKETSARDAVASKRDELRSSVSGAFTSDIFGGSDVWSAGGGSNPMGILAADIAKAGAFKGVLGQLAKAGLNGDAFAAVAQTGDIGKAQSIAAMGKAGINSFEALFNQRAAVASSVGNAAGYAAYQAQLNAQNHHLAAQIAVQKELNKKVDRLEKALKGHPEKAGKATGKAINKAAAAGQRKRVRR